MSSFCSQHGDGVAWPLEDEDRFCSWCGERLLELSLHLESQVEETWTALIPPILSAGSRPPLRMVVQHRGRAGRLQLVREQVQFSLSWLALAAKPKKIPPLNPGESLVLPLQWGDGVPCDGHRHVCRIYLRGEGFVYDTQLEVSPPPRFELDVPEESILIQPGLQRIPLRLRLTQGRAHLLQAPILLQHWGQLETLNESFPLELDSAHGRAFLDLQLEVDGDKLTPGFAGGPSAGRWEGSVEIPCGEREAYRLGGLVFRFAFAPELTLEPFRGLRRANFSVVRGSVNPVIALVAHNTPGRADLILESLSLSAPWARCATPFPVTIPAGQARTLNLELDLSSNSEPEIRLGVICNDTREHTYTLAVEVREVRPFDGSLVIDFGTSSTCAATVDENLRVRLVGLDPTGADCRLLPTLLAYHRGEPNREVLMGQIEAEAARDPDYATCVVRGLKRKLGQSDWRFRVIPFKQPDREIRLSPSEVLRDLLQFVVARAEAGLLAENRDDCVFTQCVLTHPSRFSLAQIETLKECAWRVLSQRLRDMGQPAGLLQAPITVQEPVAAALDFLHDPERHEERHRRSGLDEVDYHLLVYDFGGGTVDLTLLHVHSRRRLKPGGARLEMVVTDREQMALSLLPAVQAHAQDLALEAGVCLTVHDELGEYNREGLRRVANWIAEQGLEVDLAAAALGQPDVSLYACSNGTPPMRRTVQVVALLPPRNQIVQALARPPALADYRYAVRYQVLGATGHRRFGGEDVTQTLATMLQQRFVQAVGADLPLEMDHVPLHQQDVARRNRVRLEATAEKLKVLLSTKAHADALRDCIPGLSFWSNGREQRLSGGELWERAGCPTLAELEQAVEGRLAETVDLARALLRAHGLECPEVVLSVGKGSLLPAVQRLLRTQFGGAESVNVSDRAKTVVVEGAGRFFGPMAGIQRASQVMVQRDSPITYTVSRLGIRVAERGRGYFHEFLAAGTPVPDEGLEVVVEDLLLQPGRSSKLAVLENGGLEDRLELEDGSSNSDVSEVRRFHIELPDRLDPFAVQEGRCLAHLAKDLSLTLAFEIADGERIPFEPIAAKEFGKDY